MLKRSVSGDRLVVRDENNSAGGGSSFSMREVARGDELLVEVGGEISAPMASEFADQLLICALAFNRVTLDLNKADNICEKAFEELLRVQNSVDDMRGKQIAVKRPSPSVCRMLENIGYDDLFDYID